MTRSVLIGLIFSEFSINHSCALLSVVPISFCNWPCWLGRALWINCTSSAYNTVFVSSYNSLSWEDQTANGRLRDQSPRSGFAVIGPFEPRAAGGGSAPPRCHPPPDGGSVNNSLPGPLKGNNPVIFSKTLSIIFTIQFFILFSETLISQAKSCVSHNNRKVKKRV